MDDYIKREQALKLIESGGTWGWSKNALYDEMKNLPAADVAPVVHAKWERLNNTQKHYCPECGMDFDLYACIRKLFNYCPNCGAKMDLEDDE